VPNLRPAWFFDIGEQGEALADVGTHLVDLAQWTLFPGRSIDWRADVTVDTASRQPTTLSAEEFTRVTAERNFPDYLARWIRDGALDYFCNTSVVYGVRGVKVKLDVLWRYEAPAGAGDTHLASYRGTRSRVEVRQTREENYRPEVYVVPASGAQPQVEAAVRARLAALADIWPGLSVEEAAGALRISIPDSYRVGHEAHFGQVTRQFLDYVARPGSLPAWENPNMLAKYRTTTRGVSVSRGEL
jgi:predicted dehydrogenase